MYKGSKRGTAPAWLTAPAHTHTHIYTPVHAHRHTQVVCYGVGAEQRGRGSLHPRTGWGAQALSHNRVLVQGTPLLMTTASYRQAAYGSTQTRRQEWDLARQEGRVHQ